MRPSERWLVYPLRFGGVLLGSVFFAIFLPDGWLVEGPWVLLSGGLILFLASRVQE